MIESLNGPERVNSFIQQRDNIIQSVKTIHDLMFTGFQPETLSTVITIKNKEYVFTNPFTKEEHKAFIKLKKKVVKLLLKEALISVVNNLHHETKAEDSFYTLAALINRVDIRPHQIDAKVREELTKPIYNADGTLVTHIPLDTERPLVNFQREDYKDEDVQ